MSDRKMKLIGSHLGLNWYWAEPGHFDKPGVYYWDGIDNVLASTNSPSTAESDKEAVRNAALEEVLEWLETEVTAIDTWYRGDPSYEYDAGYMKYRVMNLLNQAKVAFKEEQPAQPSDTELLRDAITAILWLDRRVPQVYKDMSHIRDTVARLEAAMRAEREGK